MSAVPLDGPSTPLAYALAYAKLGWKVLPLEPATKRPHRLAPRGVHSATSDSKAIHEIWSRAPDAGVGIACNDSGLVVLDIDPRNGGLLTLERLEAQYGTITSNVQAITPGGGLHLVYEAGGVDKLPGTLGPGIDVKSAGYICAEPSIHPTGREYAWEASSSPLDGARPSPLPTLFRDYGARPAAVPASPEEARYVPITEQQWGELYSALRAIDADSRETWLQVGMALHSTGEADRAFAMWDEWSQKSPKYDPRDQMRVWRSFRSRGIDGVTYRTIFKMAQPGAQPAVEPEGLLLSIDQLAKRAESVRWLVKGLIPADSVGFFFGASGTFKSFIALDLSLHLAHGLPWLGRRTSPGPVVYTAAEGGLGLFRRIDAWHRKAGRRWDTAQFLVCPVPILLGDERQAKAFVAAIEAMGCSPSLVVVDTMAQTYAGDENSAQEVSQYLRSLGGLIRARFGCAVLVIHHSGHSATERPRGSSAITANADFLYGVFRDEGETIATLECVKVKDGDKASPVTFSVDKVAMGKDEDGDEVSSLVARHIDSGREFAEAIMENHRAGRGEHLAALLRAAQDGMNESELRQAFYKTLPDSASHDVRKKAFKRSRDKAIAAGFMVIDEAAGYLVRVIKPVDNS